MKKGFLRFLLLGIVLPACSLLHGQQYLGMSGLIHVPTADMDEAGVARIGMHFMNREMMPDVDFEVNGKKYHSFTHYLSITPFRWLELAYTCTAMKLPQEGTGKIGFYSKDRYFSVKLQPVCEREGKWWPSVAVGVNDPSASATLSGGVFEQKNGFNQYFSNIYVALSKHLELKQHRLGLHLAYRYWKWDYNRKYEGVVGGLTYQPAFERKLRLMVEYSGNGVNVGADWQPWRFVLLQASLLNGKYFSGGLCFYLHLL